MHYWHLLWDWNTLDSVRGVHSFLEGWALVFFGLLVLFDVLAHFAEENKTRARSLERTGLVCFAVAVLSEALAYPYSRRNDALSSIQDTEQKSKIATLENSTQGLKTDAENAHAQAEGFRSRIAELGIELRSEQLKTISAQTELRYLQLITSWREVTPEQRLRLIQALKPFPGQPFLMIWPTDPESIEFMENLRAALTVAFGYPGSRGIERSAIQLNELVSGKLSDDARLPRGAWVAVSDLPPSPSLDKAADAVASWLRAEGFNVSATVKLRSNLFGPQFLAVVIGRKPSIPDQ